MKIKAAAVKRRDEVQIRFRALHSYQKLIPGLSSLELTLATPTN